MPFYDYKCDCGHLGEYRTGIEEYQICPDCGSSMTRMPHYHYGIKTGSMFNDYYDEGLGCHIRDANHRKQVMRDQGATPKGDTPKLGDAWV